MTTACESPQSMKTLPRISPEEALELLERVELYELGERADAVRWALHPEPIVTYVVDRNINYTDICYVDCTFCAFYEKVGRENNTTGETKGYVLSKDVLYKKVEELVAVGGTQVLLQGGMNPRLSMDYYCDLLSGIKQRFPVHLHALSPPEIWYLVLREKTGVETVLRELRDAGLDTIPGGGAEILSDRVRDIISPKKCTSAQWLEVMETAHRLEMRTTATMMLGHVETHAERIEHLRLLREVQDRTGGFTAFICWTYQPDNTELGGRRAGSFEYLRTLATARLFLDNFPSVQASWVTMGTKIGQVALFYGANDMGGTMMEENVVKAAGAQNCMDEERVRAVIRDAGFTPVKRNTFYEHLETVAV